MPPGATPRPPGAPGKSGLEKALDEALGNNPDLRIAAARAREAEAVLTRARLQVTRKVVAAYQEVEAARAAARLGETRLARLKALAGKVVRAVAPDDVEKAEQALATARAKQATAEAELNYLLGKASSSSTTGTTTSSRSYQQLLRRRRTLGALETGPNADKIRKALNQRVTMKFDEISARDVLKQVARQAQGLHVQANTEGHEWDPALTAVLTDVPLGAVLQLLEDTTGCRALVRSYGLLLVPKGEAVPAGAVTLSDFWQGDVKGEPKTPARK
jgi:hypothetical protein